MAKWTLPETPDMIPRSEADAEKQLAVAAALREAAEKIEWEYNKEVDGNLVWACREILALIPDAGSTLDRALTAERERWIKEGMRIATTVPIEEIPQAIAAAIRAGEERA